MDFDATAQADQILANYEAARLIIWITIGVIVVAIIALGTEFWVNLWGLITSPSLTFQRMLGEAQVVPGLVLVAVSGLATGVIVNSHLSNPSIITAVLDMLNNDISLQMAEQLDSIFDQVGSDFTMLGNMAYVQTYVFQAQSLAVAIPVAFLISWILWGLAAQVASMIAGNKAGHGVTNIWAAIPYLCVINILNYWFYMMHLGGSGFGTWAGYIIGLYFAVLHVIMMREHGRYSIQNAIISTALTGVLFGVFAVVTTILLVAIIAQASMYL